MTFRENFAEVPRAYGVIFLITKALQTEGLFVSELEKTRKIVRKLRLSKKQAGEYAQRAFRAELGAGRPDKALQCAKEFDLGNEFLTESAAALFVKLVSRARFTDAYEIFKGYNLPEAGQLAAQAIELATKLDHLPKTLKLDRDQRIAVKRILRRVQKNAARSLKINDVDEAIELIRGAAKARETDSKVQGRAVILPADGDLMLAGDFHGNTDNIQQYINLADLDNNPKRVLVIQEILHARKLTKDKRDLSFDTILYALDMQRRYPGQVYYLIGNHDLGFHLGRDLVKAGKSLNRYLYKGMHFQFGDRYEEVVEAYKEFIGWMPAAIMTQNGIFMAHSTPKKAHIAELTHGYLTEVSAEKPYRKCRPIVAMVNGRDYEPATAEAFADRMGCEHMICGHTPTVKGLKVPNEHHIIIDSQHANARYIHFDLSREYTHDELVGCVSALQQKNIVPTEEIGELV